MTTKELDSKSIAKNADTLRLDEEIASERTKLAKEFAALRADLAVLKWMMAIAVVGVWTLIIFD